MDGDIFGAVTRLGRDAAAVLAAALHGGQWDPFLPERCLEVVIREAGGIPSLPGILRELDALEAAPLLAPVLSDAAIDRIGDLARAARGTVLDVMLQLAAATCLIKGEFSPLRVLERFCTVVLERAIIYGRGGFLELQDGGCERLGEARAFLAGVACPAAVVLRARPDAKHLRLTRHHAKITSESNLLEGMEE